MDHSDTLLFLQLIKKFPAFMEPELSLPLSQEPATCLYLHPERPIRHPHTIY
jgi:hypothetical protein